MKTLVCCAGKTLSHSFKQEEEAEKEKENSKTGGFLVNVMNKYATEDFVILTITSKNKTIFEKDNIVNFIFLFRSAL